MRHGTQVLLLTLISTAALAGCTSAPGNGGEAEEPDVTMGNFKFDPETLTIQAGETVLWKNPESVGHTVTATDGSFDSGNMGLGASFEFTFDEPGTYTYYCDPHAFEGDDGTYSGMTGTIIVEGATDDSATGDAGDGNSTTA